MQNIPFHEHRVPTFAALIVLLLLVAGLAIGTFNIDKLKILNSRADISLAPVGSVETANISDTSVTIFWATTTPTNGAVFFDNTPNLGSGVAVDERDLTSPGGKYLTHFVRLSSLKPGTKYYFKVGSGSDTFGDPNNNQAPFEISTGATLNAPVAQDPIFGKALDGSGQPAADAVAVWQSPGALKIASLVKSDANYVLPINLARTVSLNSFVSLAAGTPEKIIINAGPQGTAQVNCFIGKDRPIITVKIGQTLDCNGIASATAPASSKPQPTTSSSSAHFKVPLSGSTASSSGGLQINLNSGQTVSTTLPTISGKAGSNQIIKITIHSDTPYSGAVVAGPDGSWSWTPPANLSPGAHTVTITVVNPDGTTQTVTRNFYVTSGSPILPVTSGTPSAQSTHLACVSNACQSVSGPGADSCGTNSDCQATPSAATTSATPPVTGNSNEALVILTFAAVLLTLSGVTIFSLEKIYSNGSE